MASPPISLDFGGGGRLTEVSAPAGSATERSREWSGRDAVAQLHDAVAESVLVEELEVGADACREGRLATAEDHWPDEQLALVHEAGIEGTRRRCRQSIGDIGGVDLLVGMGYQDAETSLDELEGTPLFRALPAMTQGRYRRVDADEAIALIVPTVLSIPVALDALTRILNE